MPALTFETAGEGTYRVEVYLSQRAGRAADSVDREQSHLRSARRVGNGDACARCRETPTITRGIQGGPWHVEKDDESSAQVAQQDYPTGPVEFAFRLAGGDRAGQYAALGIGVGKALTERTHLAFRAHASRPMRVRFRHASRNRASAGSDRSISTPNRAT